MRKKPKVWVDARGKQHPKHGDLWTPITPEIIQLLWDMRREMITWRAVAMATATRLRVLRRIRSGQRKAISMTLLDRIITNVGVGSLRDYPWFTADDLVALGIWDHVKLFGVDYVEDEDGS